MEVLKKMRLLLLLLSICLSCEYGYATAFSVTSNADAGAGSLRAIITALNLDLTSTPGAPHVVTFNAAYTITLASTLPSITRHCNVNGGTLGNTVLNMGNFGAVTIPYGLDFSGANVDNSIVQRMVIHNSGGGAHVRFTAAAGVNITVTNNRFGTNAAGNGAGPRNPDVGFGVQISGGSDGNTITNNLISGIADAAILIDNSTSGGNLISGNLIGVDATGLVGGAAFTVLKGILFRFPSSGNTITNNTVSNISLTAIELYDRITNTSITNNKVGTNSAGTAAGAAFTIGTEGIFLNTDCTNNTIDNNMVSNCNSGIFLNTRCNNNIIKRNLLGTDVTGNAGGANYRTLWDAIQLDGSSSSNMIGGLLAADGNVLCSSQAAGLAIKGTSNFNRVLNNKIGVGLNGVTAIGNDRYGIYVGWGPVNNSIGAVTAGGTVYGNIVANTSGLIGVFEGRGSGIFVERPNTLNNSIRGNSVYCNQNTLNGIVWGVSIPQSNVATPSIDPGSEVSNVYGSGLALGDTVDLYYNETVCTSCPIVSGRTYIGTAIANASGNWSYTGGVPLLSRVIVTVTQNVGASFGNTSRYSPCSLPLPIELISFTVKNSAAGVQLNWSTAKEINNDYFLLKRSSDGIHFETISQIDGNGNSSVVLNYSTIDYLPFTNYVYYQLVQVDFDGKSASSNIISVNEETVSGIRLYPSLINSGSDIQAEVMGIENGKINIDVIDAMGRTVLTYKGEGSIHTLETSQLSKGVYLCVSKGLVSNSIVRFVVQ